MKRWFNTCIPPLIYVLLGKKCILSASLCCSFECPYFFFERNKLPYPKTYAVSFEKYFCVPQIVKKALSGLLQKNSYSKFRINGE